jgi:hypothetical protein
MESHSLERLKAQILPLSVSQTFDIARREWELVGVEVSEELDHCPCGQEIKEHCYIRNRVNGAETYVGNVCVNRFLGIETGNLFDRLRRIARDINANANDDLIEHAYLMGYLFGEKEYTFLKQMRLKRNLSDKQAAWRRRINKRIVDQTVVRARTKK